MSKTTWGNAIDNSDSQHFIGRKHELSVFTDEIQIETLPYKLIFFISGQGGVGKSELLRHYQQLAEKLNFVVADCDENQGNIPSILFRFASQIKQKGHSLEKFFEKYKRYQQLKLEIESDPSAPLGLASFIGQSIARVGLSLADEVPVLRQGTKLISHDAVATQAGEWAKYITQKWSNKHDELALIKEPIPILSGLFFDGLNEVAESCPVLLCFDNYEITRDYLDLWLNQIRQYEPSVNIRLIIACRTAPGPAWESSNNVLKHIPLDIFSPDEANEFLDSEGITDIHRREEILEFSGRLPVLMQWLSSPNADNPDPLLDTADIVDRFLRWVQEPNLRTTALDASIPHFFNLDILTTIFDDRQTPEINIEFEWLRKQPFIPTENNSGWKYHSVVRRLMLQYQKRRSGQHYHLIHKRLAIYYQNKHKELMLKDTERWTNEEAQDLKVEYIYHHLMEAPSTNWPTAISEIVLALKYSMGLAQKIIQTLAQPASLDDLDESKRQAVLLIEQELIELTNKPRWEGVKLYNLLSESITSNYVEANAHLCFLRAEALRIKQKDLDKALVYLEQAIDLDPTHYMAIAEKGEILNIQEKYDAAIIEFDRAIGIFPNYHFAHEHKGMALYELERFGEAIEALNKADEAYDDCFITIKYRGVCYFAIGETTKSIRDLSRALKGDPDDPDCLVVRGEAYREAGKYELALIDLEKAGKITNVHDHRRLKNIGLVLLEKKKYKQAAKKFIESLQVTPACTSCWHSLISTYEKYNPKNSITTLLSDNNFPKIEFSALVYMSRSRALALNNYIEALQDVKTALQLDPSQINSDYIQLSNLGLFCSREEKYEEAIECFNYDGSSPSYARKYNIAITKALWKGAENAVEEIQDAKKLLKQLEDIDDSSLGTAKYGYAGIEAVKNNKSTALSLLKEALELDSEVYRYAKTTDPAWKSLRSDREFIRLLALNKQ